MKELIVIAAVAFVVAGSVITMVIVSAEPGMHARRAAATGTAAVVTAQSTPVMACPTANCP
jgi:hypothetical protein